MTNTDGVQVHKAVTDNLAITLTDAAIDYVRKQITKRGAGEGVRLSIKTTGCSGYSYVLDILNNDNRAADDHIFPIADGLIIAVENKSFPLVKGTQIDFIQDGVNYRPIFDNPNQAAACGCGESFSVDPEVFKS